MKLTLFSLSRVVPLFFLIPKKSTLDDFAIFNLSVSEDGYSRTNAVHTKLDLCAFSLDIIN
jgi:hypothetical protein